MCIFNQYSHTLGESFKKTHAICVNLTTLSGPLIAHFLRKNFVWACVIFFVICIVCWKYFAVNKKFTRHPVALVATNMMSAFLLGPGHKPQDHQETRRTRSKNEDKQYLFTQWNDFYRRKYIVDKKLYLLALQAVGLCLYRSDRQVCQISTPLVIEEHFYSIM